MMNGVHRQFRQVDVFAEEPFVGNPVAVVHGADGLTDDEMRLFARWTNLSETTFLLPPQDAEADYRVRIFTPAAELPFAGHPTLGSAHAWLQSGGSPRRPNVAIQECAAGLIPLRPTADRVAFAAPPLVREGPVEEPLVQEIATVLGVQRDAIVDCQWVDNGPGWVAAMLGSADEVLALRPSQTQLSLGVVGPYPPGGEVDFEVRAFFAKDGGMAEDPVTGSLNASLAQWLLSSGRAEVPYVASQGTALGRAGRVFIDSSEGSVWVGGATVTCVEGSIDV
jgi:PhzF family phenazine biosynthesis protein